ncbi:MAG TPA: hypothetical protein PLX08_03965 [Bacteroidales bacterium]|jgi:amino acid permease|nr:hypothetical protein [Bacteroidales bacterium]
MIIPEKYDRIGLGAAAGFLIPVIIAFCVYFFSSGDKSVAGYIERLVRADIVTHIISLCVFPNIFLFLLFNRLDMLRATRGVLGITIFWAIVVFALKFLL